MDAINLNILLGRTALVNSVKIILKNFEQNKSNLISKKGIYIYGDPGSGKSTFITDILKELDYDIIKYDAGDIRNKTVIEGITKHNMSDRNVVSMFHKKVKRLAIIMDEIDGMNNGDKGGINALIKLIRPKKTKKQKLEEFTLNPIICVGNYHIDKKIKELMKVSYVIEMPTPTLQQINNIITILMPNIADEMKTNIITFVQGDLRKLKSLYELYKNDENMLNNDVFYNIFQKKSYNDDTRNITKNLLTENYNLNEHLTIMNETDRTIVALLWHENIIDTIATKDKRVSIPFYSEVLDNICFADYIDRITFQKQIWQFNEMSSIVKTFKNNKLFHDTFEQYTKPNDIIRFTKVLTKYSTEYNNVTFIQNLCQELGMDKRDLFAFFSNLSQKHTDQEIIALFENFDISKLDINRMYRYLEKYTKEDSVTEEEEIITELSLDANEVV